MKSRFHWNRGLRRRFFPQETISNVDDTKIKRKVSPFFLPLPVYLSFLYPFFKFFSRHIRRIIALRVHFWELQMISWGPLMIIPALYILLLLDLSSAFDTVDHSILLNRLEHRFGIKDTALNWFRSYLTNRKQCVSIRKSTSSLRNLEFGEPQGSALGPILYIIYYTSWHGDIFYINMVSNTICMLMTHRCVGRSWILKIWIWKCLQY